MKHHWTGVFYGFTTQIKKNGALDLDATARHTEALIDSGVNGICYLGSLGEYQSLDADENRLVMEAMFKAVNGSVPVLSGATRPPRIPQTWKPGRL